MSKDARRPVRAIVSSFTAWLVLLFAAAASPGASYTTANFVVNAPTPEFARQVGDLAEKYRDEIALDWLGKKLPRWYKPCPINVKVGQIGAGGATTFCFDRGEVFGWKMNIQGSEERILDSVLPHEISHTILACHFRRPLPRWADEGAATLVEHESERHRQVLLLNQVIRTSQRIPLKQLLSMKDYPQDMQQVLTLYAEGYSLAEYFVQQGGKQRYLQFLEDGHRRNWDEALRKNYGVQDVSTLEKTWSEWVFAGSPPLNRRDGAQIAQNEPPRRPAADAALIRSQSPDEKTDDARRAEDRSLASNGGSNSQPARGATLEAPDPRSRTPRNGLPVSNAKAGDSLADAGRGRNDGWAEQPRLPRPTPLVYRIDNPSETRNVAMTAGTNRRAEPPFEEEGRGPRQEPPFEEEDARSAASRPEEPATRFQRSPRIDEEALEDVGGAVPRPPDWSAFPQARTSPGATRNGFSSPFSP